MGGLSNLYTIIPFSTENRAVFYRERASGMYTEKSYVMSSWVELPYQFVETLIGVNCLYWVVGLNSDINMWLYFNLIYFLYIIVMTNIGLLLAALMPNVMSAQLVAAVFVNIIGLFAGT